MSIEKHKAFLDSLEPEKGLPQEMHGWRFDDSLSDFSVSNMPARPNVKFLSEMIEYLVERCRRAESRAPKQYTEQELREWFENRPLVQDEIDALLHEVVPGENEAWYSVLKFAAHVGALKAETYPDAQTIAEAGATVLEAEP